MPNRHSTRKNDKDDVIWVEGMKLGPGASHDERFWQRIDRARRWFGAGTMDDPSISWVAPGPAAERTEQQIRAIEYLIWEQARRYGLSHVWIASDGHACSTTAWSEGNRVTSPDDYHVTLRMGVSEDLQAQHADQDSIRHVTIPKKLAAFPSVSVSP
ncbi:hypothetical protein F5Y13DRAFT_190809 [Hypoxylon sp. FL1857]|nr:hypothetical protein F5Y13DRAFT_190809 [Hypoxylon sp. FL1857]